MPKKPDDTLTCQRCKLEIYGVELKHVVRLSGGVMHATCHKAHWRQIEKTIADAIAAGTHVATNLYPQAQGTTHVR